MVHQPDEERALVRQYLVWSILDRAILLVTATGVAIGAVSAEGIFFLPYLAYIPLHVSSQERRGPT